MNHWIQTARGGRFDLALPRPEQIRFADIALGLSRAARFSGQTDPDHYVYSVAQHSVIVSVALQPFGCDAARLGLMHDAAEAYIGDITKPLKRLIAEHTDALTRIEDAIQTAIETRFGIRRDRTLELLVHRADLGALALERRALMPEPPEPWEDDSEPIDVRPDHVRPWSEYVAAEAFCHRAKQLGIDVNL